jgi:hypothetical protein
LGRRTASKRRSVPLEYRRPTAHASDCQHGNERDDTDRGRGGPDTCGVSLRLILVSQERFATAKGFGYRRVGGEPFPKEITKMGVITTQGKTARTEYTAYLDEARRRAPGQHAMITNVSGGRHGSEQVDDHRQNRCSAWPGVCKVSSSTR